MFTRAMISVQAERKIPVTALDHPPEPQHPPATLTPAQWLGALEAAAAQEWRMPGLCNLLRVLAADETGLTSKSGDRLFTIQMNHAAKSGWVDKDVSGSSRGWLALIVYRPSERLRRVLGLHVPQPAQAHAMRRRLEFWLSVDIQKHLPDASAKHLALLAACAAHASPAAGWMPWGNQDGLPFCKTHAHFSGTWADMEKLHLVAQSPALPGDPAGRPRYQITESGRKVLALARVG